MGVLLVASKSDMASMTLYDAIMRLDGWSEPFSITSGDYYIHECDSVYLLVIDQIHIRADDLDFLFKKHSGHSVDDILILSRHVSRSKTPAMTLHAIGIPGILPYGEEGISGGKNGLLVPPSKYFASLFRRMNNLARRKKLDFDFDLTLETTHHGPILKTPTLYIEIGSTEDEWVREDVADCWAEVISDVLVMSGGKSRYFNPDSDVMIGFGGGHYAPRHKSVILNSEINIGHIIANYSLVFEPPKDSEIPLGPWSECIQSAVDSTRISFPKSKIFAHLDRKSFKGWQRSAITQKLEELGIEIRRGKQISQRE